MELSLAKDYLLYKKIYQRRLQQQDEFNANLAIELSEIINGLKLIDKKLNFLEQRIEKLEQQSINAIAHENEFF